jgi:hypothetical protein
MIKVYQKKHPPSRGSPNFLYKLLCETITLRVILANAEFHTFEEELIPVGIYPHGSGGGNDRIIQ